VNWQISGIIEFHLPLRGGRQQLSGAISYRSAP